MIAEWRASELRPRNRLEEMRGSNGLLAQHERKGRLWPDEPKDDGRVVRRFNSNYVGELSKSW